MKIFKKASDTLDHESIGELFDLKFHYKTYRFKTEIQYCVLTAISAYTASFLINNVTTDYDLYDEDIILYAKPSF
jgi:hypothetical protein